MTEHCKCECDNAKTCYLKYSTLSIKCPCDKCIVKLMCQIMCEDYDAFRAMNDKTEPRYVRLENYQKTMFKKVIL